MARFMPQALFDKLAITYVMCSEAPSPDKQPMIDEWDRMLKHYVDGPYKSENHRLLRCDLIEASAVIQGLVDLDPTQPKDNFDLLKVLSGSVADDEKRRRPFIKRIFGGTLFSYEKNEPTARVEQCKQDVSRALAKVGQERLRKTVASNRIMTSDSDERAMRENMEYTLNLADQILLSAGTDPLDAFAKAVGTLAQVIHIITPDDQREQTLNSMMSMLRTNLKALDSVRGPSSPTIR
jgi:hypothetical protein